MSERSRIWLLLAIEGVVVDPLFDLHQFGSKSFLITLWNSKVVKYFVFCSSCEKLCAELGIETKSHVFL